MYRGCPASGLLTSGVPSGSERDGGDRSAGGGPAAETWSRMRTVSTAAAASRSCARSPGGSPASAAAAEVDGRGRRPCRAPDRDDDRRHRGDDGGDDGGQHETGPATQPLGCAAHLRNRPPDSWHRAVNLRQMAPFLSAPAASQPRPRLRRGTARTVGCSAAVGAAEEGGRMQQASVLAEPSREEPVGPVLVVIGGLPGSGKTTLLRRLLAEQAPGVTGLGLGVRRGGPPADGSGSAVPVPPPVGARRGPDGGCCGPSAAAVPSSS